MAAKNLKYYLENTDEMPTDPKEIEALAQEHIKASLEGNSEQLDIDRFTPKGEDDKGKPSAPEAVKEEPKEEKKEEVKEAPKEEAKEVKAEEKVEKPEEGRPEGILARDGKSVIPFAVLANARERAAEAERIAREQAAEIERLKNQPAKEEKPAELTNEELKALAEDSPTLAKLLQAQQEELQALRGQITELDKFARQQISDAQEDGNRAVQEAIDRNPVLVEWQNMEDPTYWNMAARLDATLRASPEYKEVSFDDRFDKVVALTKSVLGIPDEPKVEEVKEEVKQPNDKELLALAEAKLAEKKAAMPVSLSQIPGGIPPAQDERERVEQMSTAEIGSKLMGMKSLDDINAYLNNL